MKMMICCWLLNCFVLDKVEGNRRTLGMCNLAMDDYVARRRVSIVRCNTASPSGRIWIIVSLGLLHLTFKLESYRERADGIITIGTPVEITHGLFMMMRAKRDK